jgi:CubicO group peptidase (beta-lactamase class C family)
VRVLKAETVALMGQNHTGAVSVPALKSALPDSADFTFIVDGCDKWGLGFLITADQVPGKRSPGSLSWGGGNNTFFWIDPARGIAGVTCPRSMAGDIFALIVGPDSSTPMRKGCRGSSIFRVRPMTILTPFRRERTFKSPSGSDGWSAPTNCPGFERYPPRE